MSARIDTCDAPEGATKFVITCAHGSTSVVFRLGGRYSPSHTKYVELATVRHRLIKRCQYAVLDAS